MNEIVFVCAIALAALFLRKKPLFPARLKGRIQEKPPWYASLLGSANRLKMAFSLVEMLMALLVASLLLAALAPVMTKKFNENVNIAGVGSSIVPMGSCVFPNVGTHEEACEVPNNVGKVNAIIASGGGGGGGAVKMAIGARKYSQVVQGPATAAGNEIGFALPRNALNVKVHLVGGGGGGGVGLTNGGGFPMAQSDCGANGVFIGPEYSGSNAANRIAPNNTATNLPAVGSTGADGYHSLCVSARNPEVNGGGAAPKLNVAGVKNYTAGTTAGNGNCNDAWCCWTGTTSGTCTGSNSYMNYSGCQRSVCQWNAANRICQNWNNYGTGGGRLPTQNELSHWAPGINDVSGHPGMLNARTGVSKDTANGYAANYGLQLCDAYAAGSVRCMAAGCAGSSDGHCWPYPVWSSTSAGGVDYYNQEYMGGSFTTSLVRACTYAFSVRCVQDTVSTFSPLIGGGGGPGLYGEIQIPNDVIRKAFKESNNVELRYSAGGGGTGGTVPNTSYQVALKDQSGFQQNFTNATQGQRSSAKLIVGGVTKWEISVPGGKPGNKRTDNTGAYGGTNGTGGAAINVASSVQAEQCYYYNAYSSDSNFQTGRYLPCNSITADPNVAANFEAGTSGHNGNSSNGQGGVSRFLSGSATVNQPNGGLSGINGTTPGAGGGGGGAASCQIGPTRKFAKCGSAGNGGPGKAQVSFQLARPGAGGAGGSAGAVVHLRNISNGVAGAKITAVVGGGGTGGVAGSGTSGDNGKAGTAGGASSISWTKGSTTQSFTLPGGYGGGGATAGRPDDTSNGNQNITNVGNIPVGINSIPGYANVNSSGVAQGNVSFSNLYTLSRSFVGTGNFVFFPGVNKNDVDELNKTKGTAPTIGTGGNCDAAKGCYIQDYYAAPGGNGGINSKISPKGQGLIPCGGLSKLAVDFYGMKDVSDADIACNIMTNIPSAIPTNRNVDSMMIPGTFSTEYPKIISEDKAEDYAATMLPGATGGGGGAWMWPETEGSLEDAANGQGGMPGFVIIYWNLPEETEGGG